MRMMRMMMNTYSGDIMVMVTKDAIDVVDEG